MNKITKIEINVIPHVNQRYETCGDWLFQDEGQTLIINVSEMKDNRHEMLIAVHELVEVLLCRENGVTQEMVDEFDQAYEAKRQPGDVLEPGDDLAAPYKNEHSMATAVERMMCGFLKMPWADYEREVNGL